MRHIIVVFGPGACGKSTVGKFLRETRGFEHLESDHFCPKQDLRDTISGASSDSLESVVRLHALAQTAVLRSTKHEVVVLSCPALKRSHRNLFRSAVIDHNKANGRSFLGSKISLHFLYLQISEETAQLLIQQRHMRDGDHRGMDSVRKQFETFQVPRGGDRGELSIDCTIIDAGKGVEWMLKSVEDILEAFLG